MEATTRDAVDKTTERRDGLGPATPPGEMLRVFDELNVGDRYVSRARTITETDVVNFAALTADWNPLHTDASYAETTPFGARVAHGMLLLSYSIGLVPNERIVALRRLKNVVFKKPVFFGDTIRVEATIANLVPMGDEVGLVTGRWRIVNQHMETVFKLEIEALWTCKEP
jgi:3-hydroxybutyryl-CoA dehydratase